jgi:hypothetical protein
MSPAHCRQGRTSSPFPNTPTPALLGSAPAINLPRAGPSDLLDAFPFGLTLMPSGVGNQQRSRARCEAAR